MATTRENAHLIIPANLLAITSLAHANSATFDTAYMEATCFLVGLGTGNLAITRTVTFTLMESDNAVSGFSAVDAAFTEWLMDGIPGNVAGVAGSQTWQRQVPGVGGPLTLNTEIFSKAHVFAVSYVAGTKRYLQLNVAIVSNPTNELVVVGVGFPKETAVPVYTTNPGITDFPSITWP